MKLTRRPVVVSALALIGLGIAGGVAVEAPRLLRRRARSPYDDITDQLPRETAALAVGRAALARQGAFDAAKTANSLRARNGTLARMAHEDSAHGQMLEAGGWVLPQSLGLACALLADQAMRRAG